MHFQVAAQLLYFPAGLSTIQIFHHYTADKQDNQISISVWGT